MGEAMLYQLHSLLAATALGFCRLAALLNKSNFC